MVGIHFGIVISQTETMVFSNPLGLHLEPTISIEDIEENI